MGGVEHWFEPPIRVSRASRRMAHDLLLIAAAGSLSLVVSLLLGRPTIAWLAKHCREQNHSDSPGLRQLHATKAGTPLMGGLFVGASICATLLALADRRDPNLWAAIVALATFGSIGLVDDYRKSRGARRGLTPHAKLSLQIAAAAGVATLSSWSLADAAPLWLFIPWATLVMVGSANAVNLADGLDGLAAGLVIAAATAWAWIAAEADADTPLIAAVATAGATLGFLRFNRHPARVFMGDTGSLPLGCMLGLLGLMLRQELRLMAIGGVLVAEVASVMLQVGYYKWRKRRLLRCAPLHHHFQFLGWPERRIVIRFWLAGLACAVAGVLPWWK